MRIDRRVFLRQLGLISGAAGCATLLGCGRPAESKLPPPGPGEQPAASHRPNETSPTVPTAGPSPKPSPPDAGPVPAVTPVIQASPAPSPLPASSPLSVPSPGPTWVPAGSPVARQAPGKPATVSEVVIGALYPLTGPSAATGTAAVNALRTVAEIANTRTDGLPWPWAATDGVPGLGGAKVRLVVADHQGVPGRGVAEAERLIDLERVHAIVGGSENAVTAAVSQTCEQAGVPCLTPDTPSATLHTRGLQWFFRTGPHDGHFTDGMFQFLDAFKKRTGAQIATLGLTYEDTLFGEDSGRDQKELARQYGYQVVADLKYRPRSTGLTAGVQRLKTANPDVWMPTSHVTDAVVLVRTARELDYSPRMVIAQDHGFTDPAFLAAVGSQAEGLISRSAFLLDMQDGLPLVARLNQLYRATTTVNGGQGADLNETSALVAVGMMALVDAINRAGAVQPTAIRQALQQTNIPPGWLILPWRGIRFESTGQNEQVGVLMKQRLGGRFSTIWPFELAAREVLHPLPPWSSRR